MNSRSRLQSQRGQVLVLGALGVLIVALMMFITLNVGNSIFEKIRIQQVADSATFSVATQEARAFNFYAYTNRANIANLVAAMSAHSSMTMANSVPGMFYAARDNFYNFAIREFAFCALCCWPGCTANCTHCIHGIKDLDAAWDLEDRGDELTDMVEKVDERMAQVMDLINVHMTTIAAGQSLMYGGVAAQLLSNSIQDELRQKFAPQATWGDFAFLGNSYNFLNAHQYFTNSKAKEITKYVASDIANGSRHNDSLIPIFDDEFLTDRDLTTQLLWTFPLTLVPDLLYEHTENVDGLSAPTAHDGDSHTEPGDESDPFTINSHDSGRVTSVAFQCYISMFPAVSTYSYDLSSDDDQGEHTGTDFSCDEEHSTKALGTISCLEDEMITHNCFMVYNADHDATDQNQPHVYAYLEQDLSIDGDNTSNYRGPWKINDGGKVKVVLREGMESSVQMTNQVEQGAAISKAIAYYHFPADWQEHPNFFNPYWKAKLQPFRRSEAILLLGPSDNPGFEIALGSQMLGALGAGSIPMP